MNLHSHSTADTQTTARKPHMCWRGLAFTLERTRWAGSEGSHSDSPGSTGPADWGGPCPPPALGQKRGRQHTHGLEVATPV